MDVCQQSKRYLIRNLLENLLRRQIWFFFTSRRSQGAFCARRFRPSGKQWKKCTKRRRYLVMHHLIFLFRTSIVIRARDTITHFFVVDRRVRLECRITVSLAWSVSCILTMLSVDFRCLSLNSDIDVCYLTRNA